jgi:hypothetical protein
VDPDIRIQVPDTSSLEIEIRVSTVVQDGLNYGTGTYHRYLFQWKSIKMLENSCCSPFIVLKMCQQLTKLPSGAGT